MERESLALLATTDDEYRFLLPDDTVVGFPRVTSALRLVQPGLDRIPEPILERAKRRGQEVHKAVWLLESGTGGGLHRPSIPPALAGYIAAYDLAKQELGFRVAWSERLLVSCKYRYAGRGDLGIELGARLILLDLKTGVEDPAHALQTAAYVMAEQEELGLFRPAERWILYLRPDGTYHLVQLKRTDLARDFAAFTNILRSWVWLRSHGGRNGHHG